MFDSTVAIALAALALFAPVSAQKDYVLSKGGQTGVAAMQLTVATDSTVVIIDKFEQNPLHDTNDLPVWGAVYSTKTDTARALHIITNSFCAAGTWISNGTRLRMFNACEDGGTCNIYENPTRIRITSSRWYPSSVRMADGGAFIFGGAYGGAWTNFKELNNPTYEFYPPKNINGYNGLQIPSQFLKDSLPHNMFPHLMQLPNNDIFVAANNMAMTFNWQTNTETRLPNLPNGQIITYPYSGGAVLLPLTSENNYTPEVLLCGGSQLNPNLKENEVSSRSPTSAQCSRLVLTPAGIAAGWQVESMPYGRIMPDVTILPDGKILIVNGAKTGTAGYGNVPDQIGQSNADDPAFQPLLYDPTAPAGHRFSSAGMPMSDVPRMYHSVSTLLPDGRVMIAGSNPNTDVETRTYRTEYQVEYISPPYMTKTRPTYSGLPATWNYGQQIVLNVAVAASVNPPAMLCSLLDLGYSTHGVHMDMRMVKLPCTLDLLNKKSLTITAPPNAAIYPPGPGWLYVSANGVPSKAQKVLIGNGGSPPVDQGAIDNMLANTGGP
ncbi:hypothetical protein FS749_004276 [Ceratobasidium sp. UAMH 11750]|nr:hypothetical protein FS749_004276 [Ceratobasidium sp. UAMH 11750]